MTSELAPDREALGTAALMPGMVAQLECDLGECEAQLPDLVRRFRALQASGTAPETALRSLETLRAETTLVRARVTRLYAAVMLLKAYLERNSGRLESDDGRE